jgi:hypothetical protein
MTSMLGGGGGSIDTSGLEEATNRSIDLQEMIYNQTRDDVQPWYQMGVGATNKLADLLGVSGGSVLSRDQVYNDMKDQYTTQAPMASDGYYRAPDGRMLTMDEALGEEAKSRLGYGGFTGLSEDKKSQLLNDFGYSPFQMQQSSTDYDALNAAVDARMAEQGETPEGFGSLLERFSLDKFEEDPGYQFRQQEANKALERQMAAQGVTLGGEGYGEVNPQAYRAMQELNQGLASQEYGNAYNRYTQDNLNTFNMLMGAAGMGQGSTGILATGGQNYANNVGNLTTGLASAQLNANLARQANQSSMFGNLLNAGMTGARLFAGGI